MGVYIKGMEMPTNCSDCPMCYDMMECTVAEPIINFFKEEELEKFNFVTERHPRCPLVPVPPHGDLVDLKAPFKAQYYDEMTEEWLEKMVTVEDAIYGCMVDEMPPTIIPAEEE